MAVASPRISCLAALIVFPVGLVLWTSLTDWQLVTNQQAAFVGLSNYIEVWTDERWLHGILNTFYFASCYTAVSCRGPPGWGKSAQLAAEYGIAIAKPQAIAIGQMRDAAGEVMNVAVRDGSRAAIQAEADKQAKIMNALIDKTEKDIDFRGALPTGAKLMPEAEQRIPIKAEGLEGLGN